MRRIAYLPASFMLIGIIGFLISSLWIYPVSKPYGFAFSVVFAAMIGASIVSMTHAPLPDEKYRLK
ncbi:hypothetical protein J7K74_01770 [Candidatus Woesearchaeota archaeon]|nr:hypothetical protein [Candidatus Woesearchaeota archaeon]